MWFLVWLLSLGTVSKDGLYYMGCLHTVYCEAMSPFSLLGLIFSAGGDRFDADAQSTEFGAN